LRQKIIYRTEFDLSGEVFKIKQAADTTTVRKAGNDNERGRNRSYFCRAGAKELDDTGKM
jgi:hypothetical protein